MAQPSRESDPLLKELEKLERLSNFNSPAVRSTTNTKSPSISDSLDSLIASLKDAKSAVQAGGMPEEYAGELSKAVEDRKREVEERKETTTKFISILRSGKSGEGRDLEQLYKFS